VQTKEHLAERWLAIAHDSRAINMNNNRLGEPIEGHFHESVAVSQKAFECCEVSLFFSQ
jgi:hypothetical protein